MELAMTPTASAAQLAANRANAQRSTGPRSHEGKGKSSLNAFRHGLTGQIALLAADDLNHYEAYTQRLIDFFQPVGPDEEQLQKVRHKGTEATQSATAQAVRSETRKRENAERKAWDPASLPAWLTEQVYWEKIQPLLNNISPSVLAANVGLAWGYAAKVRKGRKLPHPRHWMKLAELVGVSSENTGENESPSSESA